MADKVRKSIVTEDVGELITEGRGTYLVVNAVSKRVRQLQLGERPLVGTPEGPRDQIMTAMQEFAEGKVAVIPRVIEEPEEEPKPRNGRSKRKKKSADDEE